MQTSNIKSNAQQLCWDYCNRICKNVCKLLLIFDAIKDSINSYQPGIFRKKTLSKFNEFIFTSSLSTVKTVILSTENRVSSFILWPYCPSVHSTQCHQLVPLLWIPEPGLALASSSATSLGFLLSSATRHFQGSQPLLSILHTKKTTQNSSTNTIHNNRSDG